jgi:hypothetical protein
MVTTDSDGKDREPRPLSCLIDERFSRSGGHLHFRCRIRVTLRGRRFRGTSTFMTAHTDFRLNLSRNSLRQFNPFRNMPVSLRRSDFSIIWMSCVRARYHTGTWKAPAANVESAAIFKFNHVNINLEQEAAERSTPSARKRYLQEALMKISFYFEMAETLVS